MILGGILGKNFMVNLVWEIFYILYFFCRNIVDISILKVRRILIMIRFVRLFLIYWFLNILEYKGFFFLNNN